MILTPEQHGTLSNNKKGTDSSADSFKCVLNCVLNDLKLSRNISLRDPRKPCRVLLRREPSRERCRG